MASGAIQKDYVMPPGCVTLRAGQKPGRRLKAWPH
jgi:hypothetical protein